MCPLRFILVFFSAVLAGYYAWKSVSSSQEDADAFDDSVVQTTTPSSEDSPTFDFKMMVQNGFWVFVDMASGRYLWRNLKGREDDDEQGVTLNLRSS